MINCKDCKFWSLTKKGYTDRGDCSCPKFLIDYDVPELSADEVQVEADEGWGFMTGPQFGCIHGEARPTTHKETDR